jgi:UDP-N-acetylglucosamine--N-acetylmuramyl-(pentapeptide) pyrophosphoryl-undecaprenol N-acetylglucosamine transferase
MTKQPQKRVLMMAGGTGGHVFPGLAVACYLREQGVDVAWLGTSQGLESRLVPEAGIPLHLITISGLRGKGVKALLLAPINIFKAVWQARRVIQAFNPDVVIGMGGFVSGPGGLASWLMRRPLIIHEQNATAGLTNKMLATFAKKILQGFPSAFKPKANVILVGNPVRPEIENLPGPSERLQASRKPYRLLVLGGSLGAAALNAIVPKAVSALSASERPLIMHQTGDKHFEATKKDYESMGIQANLIPFIKDMAGAYAWADVVICRAGALTVAELCAAGLGALFVPFPYAVDDHQTANANFMVKQEAALCIQQSDLTAKRLTDIVKQFNDMPERRAAMAQSAYQLRKVHVAEKFFEICQEVWR